MMKSFRIPLQPSLKQKLNAWQWKTFNCPKGIHPERALDGTQANFCRYCGKQLVENPIKTFIGTLMGGVTVKVEAIHETHARDLIVYGSGLRYDHGSGVPTSPVKVHPHNILKLEELG